MNQRDDNNRLPYRERPSRSSISRPERAPAPVRPERPNEPNPPELPRQDVNDPAKLAQTRREFGFDDIPVDEDNMEQVRFRDIIRAWAKQTIKHSPLEEKLKNVTSKNSRLNELKNDLKWAMQADLDEPVKPAPKQPEQKQPSNVLSDTQTTAKAALQPAEPLNKTIDININFGSLPKLPPLRRPTKLDSLTKKIRQFTWTRRRIILAAAVVISVSSAVAASTLHFGASNGKTASTSKIAGDDAKKPEYTTLLPGGKTIDTLGGWQRVSPPGKDPVFAYVDKVDNIQINVSQQPLPANFKNDVNKSVAEVAKSFNATDKVEIGGTTLYIGTSSKGPQSAIFAKNNTLILMKSQAKISNDAWAAYVNSLQ